MLDQPLDQPLARAPGKAISLSPRELSDRCRDWIATQCGVPAYRVTMVDVTIGQPHRAGQPGPLRVSITVQVDQEDEPF